MDAERIPDIQRPNGAVPRKEPVVAEPRPKFKFDPTINLGHILTFVGFIATGFGAYNMIDKRVTVLEFQTLRAVQDNTAQKDELKTATKDLREDIKDVRKAVDEVAKSLRQEPRADRR